MSSMRRYTGRDRRSPTQRDLLAGLYASDVYHFDAGSGITLSGSRVQTWVDRSQGLSLAKGGGSNDPLLVTGATPAGRPAVQMDATSRFMFAAVPDLFSAPAMTIAIVLREMATTVPFLRGNSGATTYVQVRSNATHQLMFTGSTTLTGPAPDTTNYNVYVWHIAAGSFGGALTTKLLYKNGVSQALTGTPNFPAAPGASGQFRIGPNSTSGGYVAELITCEGRLLDERTLTLALGAKHGITVT